MAFGIAGLSVVADSLAAIKYGKVHVVTGQHRLAIDYKIESNAPVPQFGNNDDRVDSSPRTSSRGLCRRSASIRPIATPRTPRVC